MSRRRLAPVADLCVWQCCHEWSLASSCDVRFGGVMLSDGWSTWQIVQDVSRPVFQYCGSGVTDGLGWAERPGESDVLFSEQSGCGVAPIPGHLEGAAAIRCTRNHYAEFLGSSGGSICVVAMALRGAREPRGMPLRCSLRLDGGSATLPPTREAGRAGRTESYQPLARWRG